MPLCYLGLGSNVGEKQVNLQSAINEIHKDIGQVLNTSSIYETQAWGVMNQDSYYNIIAEVRTVILPLDLIARILAIEDKMGRIRQKKWDSRLIDIDILFYENYIISTEGLQIPHPLLERRNFVLEPLNEIVSNLIHPKLRKSITELQSSCPDKSWIKKLDFKLQLEPLSRDKGRSFQG